MYLKSPVSIRGFALNTVEYEGGNLVGCQIEDIEYSDVDFEQFIEKRSNHDGLDASALTYAGRKLTLNGVMYDATNAALQDRLLAARAALSPALAYRSDEDAQGFVPLDFHHRTASADYNDGIIPLRGLARPNGLRYKYKRSADGEADEPGSQRWSATLLMKNAPLIGQTAVEELVTATSSGSWTHRGNYPSHVEATFVVGTGAGAITITAGGTAITLVIPAATGDDRVVYYNGPAGVVEVNGVIRMDYLSFPTFDEHPEVQPGTSAWSVLLGGAVTLVSGSIKFNEAYA